MDDIKRLHILEDELEEQFKARRRVMSFNTYFKTFCQEPTQQLRTAPAYMRDCMDHYGSVDVPRAEGDVQRFQLFDCPWDDGRHRLIGQEHAQTSLYRQLQNFIRDGRVTQLILLHGPNGSAKSSFIHCLARALEHYSTLDEGATYRFNWVFPTGTVGKKKLGFAGAGERDSSVSFAELDDEEVDARLPGDLRDHPLLLLPKAQRAKLFKELERDGLLPKGTLLGEYFLEGDLSPRSRKIADALLSAYMGDFERVLMHVQVERFFFSRRYRRSLVTVEPQMHVDATIRQVTMDQSLQSLPPALRHLSLFEPAGDLVDANRGMIEYNDLLKKPVEGYKYLLATCEKGTVSLPDAILHLDTVFLASSNETHLNAFKEHPDFPSFKGRMAFIKMPYLRNYRLEAAIYDEQIRLHGLKEQALPHTAYVLGLWAVMTRLKRPDHPAFPESIQQFIKNLSVVEKAELLAGTRVPAGATRAQSRVLNASIHLLLDEDQAMRAYEGSAGASPREMKDVMLNALQNPRFHGLSPLAVFAELRELVKQPSVYAFLRIEHDRGYHDCPAMIDVVVERYFDRVNADLRGCLGLVTSAQYDELFTRYIQHVKSHLKKEKVLDPRTGEFIPPDLQFMQGLEGIWGTEKDHDTFRSGLLARVAAWHIDHGGKKLEYTHLFPELLEALAQDYFDKQEKTVKRMGIAMLARFDAKTSVAAGDVGLTDDERDLADEAISRLVSVQGYPRESIPEVLAALLKARY